MSPAMVEDRVRTALEHLRLRRMAEQLDTILGQASKEEASYLEVLDRLLACEQTARYERTVLTKTRLAHLPYHKTIGDFDYTAQPSIDKKQINDLFTLRFLHQAENVLFLGPPGVGKTHLAVALALETITQGHTAYFTTLQHLIEYLAEGAEPVAARMRILLRPTVLIIDEVGYLPLDRQAANWLFELVSRRYERGSIILTSNKSYGDWGSIFPEVAIASATLDRLLHHSTTITIRGESYRLKEKRRAGLFQRLDNDHSQP